MQTSRIALALLTLILAACAPRHRSSAPTGDLTSAAAATGVLGRWKADAVSYLESDKEWLEISTGAVTVTKVCKGWGRSTRVWATAPSRVSGALIEVRSPLHAVSGPGQLPCEVKMDAGVMSYEVQGDALVLTPANGTTYVYGHRRVEQTRAWSNGGRASSASQTSSDQRTHRMLRQQLATMNTINMMHLMNAWSAASQTSSSRSSSRPGTYTRTTSFGTGVVRTSGRSRGR